MPMEFSPDRTAGLLLGLACGDALGAGYEFGPTLDESVPVHMIGGGIGDFEPGEWTDDTAMALCITRALATGGDFLTEAGLNAVADNFHDWIDSHPKDIGVQTRNVLSLAPSRSAADLTRVAHERFERYPDHSAGNGSLMRTAAVALGCFDDDARLAEATRAVNDLTHPDPVCAEACVLWTLACAHAVRHGNFDGVHRSLDHLPPDRAAWWRDRLLEAESRPAESFVRNAWVVEALQTAWSVIARTPVPDDRPTDHFKLATEAAVRVGNDTDTVAAIAGSLLGARWGLSATRRAGSRNSTVRRASGHTIWRSLRSVRVRHRLPGLLRTDPDGRRNVDNLSCLRHLPFWNPTTQGARIGPLHSRPAHLCHAI